MATAWVRVHVRTTEGRAELVADLLWQAGCAGIEEQRTDGDVTLLAGFDDRADAHRAIDDVAASGLAAGEVREVHDDGLDAWRAWATIERAGPFQLVPAWIDPPPPAADERLLLLDPGRSFGSGSHPTTRLVLSLIAAHAAADRPLRAVLDVGCGSGVLAIGAVLLGAEAATGIDIDPAAPAVTLANAARNGVADRVRASSTPLADLEVPPGGFDLVLANLLAPVIAELAPDLVRATAPGGRLVASGLLADRWADAATALEPLVVEEVVELDGWAAVVLRHGR